MLCAGRARAATGPAVSVVEQVERYFAARPWLDYLGRANFGEEHAVADLTLRGELGTGSAFGYDCISDVPPDLKAALEPLAHDTGFFQARGLLQPETARLTAAPPLLVDFTRAPFGGAWKPLPDHGGEPTISVRSFFHHSIVGSAAGAWGYFANKTVLESTFIVHKSGYFWQCMSLAEQADAQLHANDWAASAETEDDGDPNTDPWTAEQIATLVWLTWEVERLCSGMTLRVLPTWDASGFGYHSQFGAPSDLTDAVGKTCPGTIRIRQWKEIVTPTILRGGALVLDSDDKKWIDDKVTAMREAIRDQDLRRLGHALTTGAPAGSNQQYDPRRAGYEWLADSPGLIGIGRSIEAVAKAIAAQAFGVNVDELAAILRPLVGQAISEAIEAHPISMQLADTDRQAIIAGAGDAAATRIAERMAT